MSRVEGLAEIVLWVADMEAATSDCENSHEHEDGVGLAALQVDNLLRINVVRIDFDNQ